MHPSDAVRLGIGRTGDLIRVETDIGYFVAKAWITEGIRPGVVDAVTDVAGPALTGWAALTRRVLTAGITGSLAPARLPLALRAAPLTPDGRVSDMIGAITTPVRSGIILTRRLALGAGQAGVGHRIGERRFTLRAMLEQDPGATLAWLADEARRWQRRHGTREPGDATSRWWTARAAGTAQLLQDASAVRCRQVAVAETATDHAAAAGHDERRGRGPHEHLPSSPPGSLRPGPREPRWT